MAVNCLVPGRARDSSTTFDRALDALADGAGRADPVQVHRPAAPAQLRRALAGGLTMGLFKELVAAAARARSGTGVGRRADRRGGRPPPLRRGQHQARAGAAGDRRTGGSDLSPRSALSARASCSTAWRWPGSGRPRPRTRTEAPVAETKKKTQTSRRGHRARGVPRRPRARASRRARASPRARVEGRELAQVIGIEQVLEARPKVRRARASRAAVLGRVRSNDSRDQRSPIEIAREAVQQLQELIGPSDRGGDRNGEGRARVDGDGRGARARARPEHHRRPRQLRGEARQARARSSRPGARGATCAPQAGED